MELTALIVDDEQKNQLVLEKLLSKTNFNINIIGKVFNANDAIREIKNHHPDIVFLDVEMPGGSGFNVLEAFPDAGFNVIFTTAHDMYALKAFRYAAVDYLLKPINFNELTLSLTRLINRISESPTGNNDAGKSLQVLQNSFNQDLHFTKIALPSSEGYDFVDTDQIVRCEADRSYCNFFLTDSRKVLVSKSLKEFEELLEDAGFYRVHKSNMVNLKHIKKYIRGSGGYIIMSDNSNVSVSARRKDQLLSILSGSR